VGRDLAGAVVGRVCDGDTVFGGRGDVDIFDTDAGPGDHLQVVEGIEDGAPDGGVHVDDQSGGIVGDDDCGVDHRIVAGDDTVHMRRGGPDG